MKKLVALLILLIGLMISSPVSAARGVVVYFDNYGSRKMVILDSSLQTFSCGHVMTGGYLTTERDVVAGKISFLGLQEIYNLRSDESFSIFIEECYLDLAGAKNWLRNTY